MIDEATATKIRTVLQSAAKILHTLPAEIRAALRPMLDWPDPAEWSAESAHVRLRDLETLQRRLRTHGQLAKTIDGILAGVTPEFEVKPAEHPNVELMRQWRKGLISPLDALKQARRNMGLPEDIHPDLERALLGDAAMGVPLPWRRPMVRIADAADWMYDAAEQLEERNHHRAAHRIRRSISTEQQRRRDREREQRSETANLLAEIMPVFISRKRLATMEEALANAEKQFIFYAEQHEAKGTEDGASKAVVNRQMAEQMRFALKGPAKASNVVNGGETPDVVNGGTLIPPVASRGETP